MPTSTPAGLSALRTYFDSGATKSHGFRLQQLRLLKKSILDHEQELYHALQADLKKSPEETWITETGFVLAEIRAAIRNLRRWMAPEKVSTNLLNFPSSSRIEKEPLGVVLIVGPWNYPFQLLINPLVGAIAAGNCVVLKPSELAPATEEVMRKIIESVFHPQYILYKSGDGATVVPGMIRQFRFDHIFFTGSTAVGREVYKLAAEQLVPVTLELGGKSPCIVENDANIRVAARRIVMTKFSNAGQMCVAPDYLLVHEDVKDELIDSMKSTLEQFFGPDPKKNDNYGKIINEKQFARVRTYLQEGEVLFGGDMDAAERYIGPTLMRGISANAAVMRDEIFGPVLPVIGFKDTGDALRVIRDHPEPLSFYVFTSSREKEKKWLDLVPAGGCCINNASWHLTNHHLPFGGRGPSGIGKYHGRFSFETFSHSKAVMKTPTWFDPAFKYPPLRGKLKWFKKVTG